jgi:N-formylglutamate amidohydrolase
MAPMDRLAAPRDDAPPESLAARDGASLAGPPAFDMKRAVPLQTAVIFTSPHSGRFYPPHLMAASRLGAEAIRRSEDCMVDQLIDAAPAFGFALICARYARAYIDLNREAYELDPAMFEDALPAFANATSNRVAAGLGAIAKVVGEGKEIYARKLRVADALDRINSVHLPYHLALEALLAETRQGFGGAILIDWHSMPSAAARASGGRGAPDFVLGDRYGAACAPALSSLVAKALKGMGYAVGHNIPYAGGYTTQTYGDPGSGRHALQIEINRGLYLNESSLSPNARFARLKDDLERLFQQLAEAWRSLL